MTDQSPRSDKNLMVNDECDYLVVGAGTSGMSFVDTLLTEKPNASVILIDRNAGPGGHWTTAYPFVRLHQHSCFYGVNSLPLGEKFDRRGHEIFDYEDRATGREVLEYYAKVLETFRANPNFQARFRCEYRREESPNVHAVRTSDGDDLLLRCRKLVMIRSAVVVPSMRPAPFPVHESVPYVAVNDLLRAHASGKYARYVILGAGKTSLDAVVGLLRAGADPSAVRWVVSRDVWFFVRNEVYRNDETHYERLEKVVDRLLAADSAQDFLLRMEDAGVVARLDPGGEPPAVMKGPQIDGEELALVRTVKDVVRRGRVQSIEAGGVMVFASDRCSEEAPPSGDARSTVFVDCMAENFKGYTGFSKDFKIFEPHRINLGPLLAVFNPSFSAALIAYMESKIEDDKTKNACCFWGTSPDTVAYFFQSFYGQIKTLTVLMKTYAPAGRFILYSRTNSDAIMYHGGLVRLLWAQFGPRQLKIKTDRMIRRMEMGEYGDFRIDKEFVNRPLPPTVPFITLKQLTLPVACLAVSIGYKIVSRYK